MFGSSIIDIAIGMIFVYLLLSLICSAANEIIERYSKKRAHDLENGIKEILHSDKPGETAKMVKAIYEHPLIYSLFAKPYEADGKTLPSYIPARNFALALMDMIGERTCQGATGAGSSSATDDAMVRLRAAVAANTTLPDQVKTALLTFVDASNNPAKVRENIENWFDSSMDRVSGTYKRRSQLIVMILGLVISIALNVDSIALIRILSTDGAKRDSLVAAAAQYAANNPAPTVPASSSPSPEASPSASPGASPSPSPKASPSTSPSRTSSTDTASSKPTPSPTPCDARCRVDSNLKEIDKLGLPIGWILGDPNKPQTDPRQFRGVEPADWLLRFLGWIITALALSLGAPFWFDLLNKFMVVRSTVKPKEKSPEEKSKD